MNLENFSFTFEENEEGYTVMLKGDKEKLKSKLEAFEAFLNFREKAKNAGWEHHGEESPLHSFMRAMHKHHGAHHGYGEHQRHCGHHGHHGYYGDFGSEQQDVAEKQNEGEGKSSAE